MTVTEPLVEPATDPAGAGPWLSATVAISGACVLAIEILGTRLLGPFYGVDLFLWSALISTTLAALSLGCKQRETTTTTTNTETTRETAVTPEATPAGGMAAPMVTPTATTP